MDETLRNERSVDPVRVDTPVDAGAGGIGRGHGILGPAAASHGNGQGDGAAEASTLANVHAGESARITRILFGALRSLCDDLGLRENEQFHCRAATATMLVLEAEDGHIVSLARDWARFIRVESVQTLSSQI